MNAGQMKRERRELFLKLLEVSEANYLLNQRLIIGNSLYLRYVGERVFEALILS